MRKTLVILFLLLGTTLFAVSEKEFCGIWKFENCKTIYTYMTVSYNGNVYLYSEKESATVPWRLIDDKLILGGLGYRIEIKNNVMKLVPQFGETSSIIYARRRS